MRKNWKICKYFIFRCAGFPFELMESLKFKRTFRLISRVSEDKERSPNLSDLSHVFEDELFKKRRQLQRVSRLSRFQEAVLHQHQENPGAFKSILKFSKYKIERKKRNSYQINIERLTYKYLQRFCTKNETVSFFGPFFIGEFGQIKNNILIRVPQFSKIKKRKVYITLSLLERISDNLSKDNAILGFLKPRLAPDIYLDRLEAIRLKDAVTIELDNIRLKILTLADGQHSVSDIVIKLKQEGLSEEQVFNNIRRLIKEKLLLGGLEFSSKINAPEEYILRKLSQIPAAKNNCWLRRLRKLVQLKRKFEGANLSGREAILVECRNLFSTSFNQSTSGDQPRQEGFFIERCEQDIEKLVLGKNIHKNLVDALSFVLDLASYNYEKLNKLRLSLLRGWLKVNFPAKEANVKEVIYKIIKAQAQGSSPFKLAGKEMGDKPEDILPDEFLSLIDRYKRKGLLSLNRKKLERDFEHYLDNGWPKATCCDIFISAKDATAINKAKFNIVFGEAHQMRRRLRVYNFFVETSSKADSFAGEIEKIQQDISKRSKLGEFLIIPQTIIECFYDSNIPLEIGYEIYSERQKGKLDFSDLKISLKRESLELTDSNNNPILLLDNLPAIGSLFSILSPAIYSSRTAKESNHSPRVKIDKFVFQRQEWAFLKDELFFTEGNYSKEGVELWLDLERWRRKENVQKYIFLKTDTEQKPIFIDFENYFSLEVFINFSKKADRLIFVREMLPAPQDLWFKDKEGRYTCEFRLILYKGQED